MNVAALFQRAAASNNIRVANVEMPEQNGGIVTINIIKNVVVNDHLYDAYVFSINADARYLLQPQQWYKAFVHGRNEVIIQFPSMPYADLNDTEAFIRERRLAANIDDGHYSADAVLRNAEAVLRNAALDNQDRQWTTVCFQLPRDLDNNVFSPNMGNGIEAHIIPEVQPGSTTSTRAKVDFIVAIA